MMTPAWKARNAVIAAACGWAVAWLIGLTWITSARLLSKYPGHGHLGDDLSFLLIYLVCTGVVTLGVALVLIIPYVALRSSASILRRPWRMYLEPCLLGLLCIVLVIYNTPADRADIWRHPLNAYTDFAIVTSLASSFFFLRRLRAHMARLEADSTMTNL